MSVKGAAVRLNVSVMTAAVCANVSVFLNITMRSLVKTTFRVKQMQWGWDLIDRINTATCVCLSHTMTCISQIICHGILCLE